MWGSCFWFCTPAHFRLFRLLPPALPPPRTTCPQTTYSHPTCPHITCSNQPITLSTYNLITPNFPHTHTTCPHTSLYITYSHTTCSHTTYSDPTCSHPTYAHTQQLVHTQFCVAGAALGDSDLHFAWQAWHVATSIFTLRGRRGTWLQRPALCVAGVALMSLGWL